MEVIADLVIGLMLAFLGLVVFALSIAMITYGVKNIISAFKLRTDFIAGLILFLIFAGLGLYSLLSIVPDLLKDAVWFLLIMF